MALGMAVMLLTICIMLGFKREIQNKLTGLNAAITISSTTINSSQEQNPIVMTKDSLLQLSQSKEISHLQGIAYKNGIIKTEDENEGIVLKGVDVNYDFNFIRQNLVQGQLLNYSDTITLPEIVVSKALADAMHFQLNKKILVYFVVQRQALDTLTGSFYTKFEQRSRRFKLVGIFNTGFSDFDKNLAFIDIGVIRKLNYWTEQQVGAYEIAIQNFKNLEELKTRVEDNVGYNYRVETIVDQQVALFGWLDMIDVNGIIIITLMIIVAGINMITALLILILERTNMVGLIKSLGMSNASVRKIFLNIALQLLGKGMLWGNIAGLGLCVFQYFTHAIKLDSATYYISYVAIEFNWMYIIGINVLTFVISILLLLLPTLLVTRLTPIKTLRFS